MVYSDRSKLDLSDETMRIQNDEKTSENKPKLLRCRKAHTFQTIKDIDLKY